MRTVLLRTLLASSLLFSAFAFAEEAKEGMCGCGKPKAECEKTGCTCGEMKDGGQCPLHPNGMKGGAAKGHHSRKDTPPKQHVEGAESPKMK